MNILKNRISQITNVATAIYCDTKYERTAPAAIIIDHNSIEFLRTNAEFIHLINSTAPGAESGVQPDFILQQR